MKLKRLYKKKWLIDEYCKVAEVCYSSTYWCVDDRTLAMRAGLISGTENKKQIRKKLNDIYCAWRDGHPVDVKRVLAARKAIKTKRENLRRGNATAKLVNSDAFLASYEWRVARMKVLKRDGARCVCCGATPDDGLKMHVDHIKPRKTHPELALDLDNLQVLCEVCNHGKGNWDSTDWRKKPAANDTVEEEQQAHIRSIVHG